MKCPDVETLIKVATGHGGSDAAEVVLHASKCGDCRKNLEIIHETMLATKWQNVAVEVVAKPTAPEEYRCSVCGTVYRSKSSVRQLCAEPGCKAAICFDCWSRLGVHKCPEHSRGK